ncbi:MAG: hypothetical protein KF819_01340 [Labilithrix sp.]|nr:hypothetical protein [Labilithrix sp.]
MRHFRVIALVCLSSASLALPACTAAPDDDDVEEVSSELVQFAAANFAGAPTLAYGGTSVAIDTSRTKWGVVQWNGANGDEIVATVAATTPDRMPRAYLVEKRADGKYVAILSGTHSLDGLVRAKLDKTQQYFIVFRDQSRRNASFTVKLERAGALPASCAGPALLEPGIVDRTPQAQAPALTATGVYETNIRRCNVATGCADPVRANNPNANITMTKRADGKWIIGSPFSAEHDGATGELKGSAQVRADDGRSIAVNLTGAATTACVSLSGRQRTEIDTITYYDVEVSFRATTPPVAARTPYPATPPATECDGQDPIPDEEVLARFPRGAASVVLGQANVMEDQQYCHPQTGCRPWSRAAAVIGGGQRALRSTAVVLGRDSIGINFYNTYSGQTSASFLLDDGALAVTSDQLMRGNVANTSSISDTHLLVKETNTFVQGEYKYRRYVCIPIPAHP